ncbi:MAG: PhzF family phenazine biosynthesis protein, partial [Marinomonas sp.]
CAFAVKDENGAADWELCWFSAAGEIALCGHATLAAAHVLLNCDGKGAVTFRTRQSGLLEVKREGAGYTIALPAIATEPKSHPQAAALLGALPTETHRSALRHNIFLFENEAAIRALTPDFVGLAMLGNDQFICTAPGDRKDIVSRVFVPGGGANEDSVTGSAHAALAPFWAAKLGRTHFTAHQASERGGDLTLRLDGSRVWLGGQCVSVSEGDVVS